MKLIFFKTKVLNPNKNVYIFNSKYVLANIVCCPPKTAVDFSEEAE